MRSTGRSASPRCRLRRHHVPPALRPIRWVALLAAAGWVWGCSAPGAPAPPAPGGPTPTASPTPTICAPDLGPTGTARAEEALFAVQLSLAGGASLADAIEAVFGLPISAMTTAHRADALRVLAGLDLCPGQSSTVRDNIPALIHRIAEQGGTGLPPDQTQPAP